MEIYPESAFAYNNRGNAKGELGDTKGAIADFNKAIEINPQYTDASASSIQRWG
ncbi:MAG: tetratricopeptide repeat protein [Prochlorococcus sp.]